jgi:hypothetical protein
MMGEDERRIAVNLVCNEEVLIICHPAIYRIYQEIATKK